MLVLIGMLIEAILWMAWDNMDNDALIPNRLLAFLLSFFMTIFVITWPYIMVGVFCMIYMFAQYVDKLVFM